MTRTNHPLPFQSLSPQDFERLSLWLARREGFEGVEHLGASGHEGGRDIVAWREGRRIIFQCKREKRFGPRDAQEVIEEILRLREDRLPSELILVVACNVSDATRERARECAGDRFVCSFWAGAELDERTKRHRDVVEEFFDPEAGAPRVPFLLPQADVSTFTGREEELARLRELLLEKKGPRLCGIVGLAGTGGIGKSALACHFAELHRDDFPDGVIGLRVDGKNVDTLAREFLRSCGLEVDPEDERSASTLMQDVFRPRRTLLIFDNADHAAVRDLLPGGKRCAVLVTTRDQALPALLDIPAEGTIDLQVLPGPDCKQLLEHLLGSERVSAEPIAIAEIIRLVGNLPLALQIVGANLREQPWRRLAEYAVLLAEERSRLERLRVRGTSHLDVRASFSLNLLMLTEAEIDFLAALSVCARSGFSVRGAQAATGSDEGTTHERLGVLCRYSLLNSVDGKIDRFVFHPLIHLFARELAEERGLRKAAEERHADFFTALIKSADLKNPDAEALLAEELKEVLLAGERLLRLGRFYDALDAFQRSHKVEVELDNRRGQAMVLNSLGSVFQRLGRFEEAFDAFQRSYELLFEFGDQRGQAMVLNSIGSVFQRLGRFDEVLNVYQQSHELLIGFGDQRGQAMVLNSLGGVFQRLGRFDEALNAFQKSRAIVQELGDQRSLAMVLISLGGVLQRLGRLDEALNTFQQSHELFAESGDQRGQSMVLNSIGGVFQRLGRFDEALNAFQKSYTISQELGDQRSLAMVLNSIGGAFQRLGRFDEALNALQRSQAISEELDDQNGLAMVLNSLGGVLQRLGRFDEALDFFQRSIRIGEALDDARHLAMVHTNLGRALAAQARLEEAARELDKGFEIDARLRHRSGLTIVTPVLVGVLRKLHRHEEARNRCRQALAVAPKEEKLLRLERSLSRASSPEGGLTRKRGVIKHILEHARGYRFTFIAPDDGGPDIYAREGVIDEVFSHLGPGIAVEVEIEQAPQGPRAVRLSLLEGKHHRS